MSKYMVVLTNKVISLTGDRPFDGLENLEFF